MKYTIILSLIGILFSGCSTSKKEWADFKKEDCSKYHFGRIEAKRLLTEDEKKLLSNDGIHVQEFVFETQYLGSWEQKWAGKSLEKTAIKSLVSFSPQDKLASGMQIKELQKLADTPGESMVLLQTIATVNPLELRQFGRLVFSQNHFYRMVVAHNKLIDLIEFPCLRMMSIVKSNYDPDNPQ